MSNLCSQSEIGVSEYALEEFRSEWSHPNFNLATDSRVVFTPEDKLVGVASVSKYSPHVQLWVWSQVHPDYIGQGIGTMLLGWLNERSRQLLPKTPDGARVTMLCHAREANVEAHELLLAQGFEIIRHFFEMRLEMHDAPSPAKWPQGITVRPCTADEDFRALYAAHREMFRDHWGFLEAPFDEGFADFSHYLRNDPDFVPELWFLAMDSDVIVGMSHCYHKTTEDPDSGLVESLGVLRHWRKRGLGSALLQHSFEALYRREQRKVLLGVDAESLTGATRLYERAGMHVFRRYDQYEKELRSGVDLARQNPSPS